MQAASACVCSCCEAQPSDNPATIFLVYISAFIPLGFLYAFDFISDRWKSIWDTRRIGYTQLCLSIPGFAMLTWYIVLNFKDGDAKEAFAAIAVLVVNFYNFCRTAWGLIQLYEFRNWNVQAILTLLSLGYSVPTYQSSSKQESGRFYSRTIRSLWNRVMRKQEKASEEVSTISLEGIIRTVNNHMVVNDTLIDNEFKNNPFVIMTSLAPPKNHGSCRRHSKLAKFFACHLKCRMPKECTVRWLVSFLARFGYRWVSDTSCIGSSDISDPVGRKKKQLQAAVNVATIASCHVVIDSESVLSPSHRFCSSPGDSRTSIITNDDLAVLPFGTKWQLWQQGSVDLSHLKATIRDAAVDDWHKTSFNELNDKDMEAVRGLDAVQISCFAKLMMYSLGPHHGDDLRPMWDIPAADDSVSWTRKDPRVEIWLYQMGCDDIDDAEELLSYLPVRPRRPPISLLGESSMNSQVCIHTDNVLAHETGARLEHHLATHHKADLQTEFQTQYSLEKDWLAISIALEVQKIFDPRGTYRFVGCVIEFVRSRIAEWVDKNRPASQEPQGWRVSVNSEYIRIDLSEQLKKDYMNHGEQYSWTLGFRLRLLGEAQTFLAGFRLHEDADPRRSMKMIILFLLGFPSLSFRNRPDSTSALGLQVSQSLDEEMSIVSVNKPQDLNEGISASFSIVPVGGPQDMKVGVKIDESSEFMTLHLYGETEFIWQLWRDAFWGRIAAQKDWRSPMPFSRAEFVHEYSTRSIESPMIYLPGRPNGLRFDFTYWSGWPPHVARYALFETSKVRLHSKQHSHDAPREPIDEYREHVEVVIGALEKLMSPGPSLKRAYDCLEDGHEEEGLRVLGRLIADGGSREALEIAVNSVLKKNPVVKSQQEELISSMFHRFLRLCEGTGNAEESGQAPLVDLNILVQYLRTMYREIGGADALAQNFDVLFRGISDETSADYAIAIAKSFLYLELSKSLCSQVHMYLAIAYGKLSQHVRKDFYSELCAESLIEFGKRTGLVLQVGLLLEKGYCSKSESEKLMNLFLASEAPLTRMFERLFVKLRNRGISNHAIGITAHREKARELYHAVANLGSSSNEDKSNSLNRLGILSYFDSDRVRARAYFRDAVERGSGPAVCNLHVVASDPSEWIRNIDHPTRMISNGVEWNNIGVILAVEGELFRAEEYFRRSKNASEYIRGVRDVSRYNLSFLMALLGYAEAAGQLKHLASKVVDNLKPASDLREQMHKCVGHWDQVHDSRRKVAFEIEEFNQHLMCVLLVNYE